jgi:hypothetical protein
MGFLQNLLKGDADQAHDTLAEGISGGLPKSHAMTGAIVVTTNDKKTVLMRATANYTGTDYRVEMDLMSKLFDFTRASGGGPWVLPANCRVYLYVYDSPCTDCTDKLERTMKIAWLNGGKNTTVTWKLGFTKWYLKPRDNGHASVTAATAAYNNQLVPRGWRWKQVVG